MTHYRLNSRRPYRLTVWWSDESYTVTLCATLAIAKQMAQSSEGVRALITHHGIVPIIGFSRDDDGTWYETQVV